MIASTAAPAPSTKACTILNTLSPTEISELSAYMNTSSGQKALCNLTNYLTTNSDENTAPSDCSSTDPNSPCKPSVRLGTATLPDCTNEFCFDHPNNQCMPENPDFFSNGTEYVGRCVAACGIYGNCGYDLELGVEIIVDTEDQTASVVAESGRRKKGIELVKFLLMKKKAVRSWKRSEKKRTGAMVGKNRKRCTMLPPTLPFLCFPTTWTCSACILQKGSQCTGACWSPSVGSTCCMAKFNPSC